MRLACPTYSASPQKSAQTARAGFAASPLIRLAAALSGFLDADWEQHTRDAGAERQGGGGGGGRRSCLSRLPMATPLSVRFLSPSPSLSGPTGRRRREEEAAAAAADAAAAAISGASGASFTPPPGLPLPHSVPARAAGEEAAGRGGSPRRRAPVPGRGPSPVPLPGSGSPASPMEPLPTQGQILRHYTATRPRPRRTHTQPPSPRPQEPVIKAENEASEAMGRVDEGVEEFFTKKIIPDHPLKGRWEESIPARATPSESSFTPSASTPSCSSSDNITPTTPTPTPTTAVPSPSSPRIDTSLPSADVAPLSAPSTFPTPSSVTNTTLPNKNVKKKFGDFFAFKRSRAGRATKAGGGEGGGGGGGEGVKVKRTSIADLIRPLREAKDREREKGRGARSVEDANVSDDAAVTEGTVATGQRLAGDAGGTTPPPAPSEIPPSRAAAAAAGPDPTAAATLSNPREEAPPVSPGRTTRGPAATSPPPGQERSGGGGQAKEMRLAGTPHGDRRAKVTKRSLREGKSQSLILLTGLEPEDKDGRHKKYASESTSSFEQRLQVMLHRMGVAKTPPAQTKASQNTEEDLRKANSEGAILDKPAPPATHTKPRTMSTSSADPRHPVRALDTTRPDSPPPLKPVPSERPAGPLPPKPAVKAKPPLPPPASPAGFASRAGSSAGRVQLRAHLHDGGPTETAAENGSQGRLQGADLAELLHQAPSPWRCPGAQDRSEKAQSATDESLPRTRQHAKALPQRRAVSVHEDALAMTQELKAVLQRSPIRFRGNRGDLPTCTEHSSGREEAKIAPEAGDGGKREPKAEPGRTGCEEETRGPGRPSSAARGPQETFAAGLVGPTAPRPVLERPPAATEDPERKAAFPATWEKRSPVAPPSLQTFEKPTPGEKSPSATQTRSPERPRVSPLSHKRQSPGTSPATADAGGGRAVSKPHTMKAEPADQRTEPPPSE